ncbi:hypothetical protein BLNAU_4730 [Blattamonas nauphoetae]|uniref:Uncharacterized protein n=1 Tax=Blattamonas nauphoetae TaxID=2049346 RepID=A0ABQ9Y8T5_9EUKA|nr:hypothetical protein BLNAU_4730 [Blattamonas nauphoetae]
MMDNSNSTKIVRIQPKSDPIFIPFVHDDGSGHAVLHLGQLEFEMRPILILPSLYQNIPYFHPELTTLGLTGSPLDDLSFLHSLPNLVHLTLSGTNCSISRGTVPDFAERSPFDDLETIFQELPEDRPVQKIGQKFHQKSIDLFSESPDDDEIPEFAFSSSSSNPLPSGVKSGWDRVAYLLYSSPAIYTNLNSLKLPEELQIVRLTTEQSQTSREMITILDFVENAISARSSPPQQVLSRLLIALAENEPERMIPPSHKEPTPEIDNGIGKFTFLHFVPFLPSSFTTPEAISSPHCLKSNVTTLELSTMSFGDDLTLLPSLFPHLVSLTFTMCQFQPFVLLPTFSSLRTITFSECTFDLISLDAPTLQSITIDRCACDTVSIQSLLQHAPTLSHLSVSSMPNLTSLVLYAELNNLSSLASLQLSNLQNLSEFIFTATNLESLLITRCPRLSIKTLQPTVARQTHLRSLTLSGVLNKDHANSGEVVTDNQLFWEKSAGKVSSEAEHANLIVHPTLTSLDLSYSSLDFQLSLETPNLETLILDGCNTLDDMLLNRILNRQSKPLTRLKSLSACSCTSLCAPTISDLPTLSRVSFARSKNLKTVLIDAPNLTWLCLTGCLLFQHFGFLRAPRLVSLDLPRFPSQPNQVVDGKCEVVTIDNTSHNRFENSEQTYNLEHWQTEWMAARKDELEADVRKTTSFRSSAVSKERMRILPFLTSHLTSLALFQPSSLSFLTILEQDTTPCPNLMKLTLESDRLDTRQFALIPSFAPLLTQLFVSSSVLTEAVLSNLPNLDRVGLVRCRNLEVVRIVETGDGNILSGLFLEESPKVKSIEIVSASPRQVGVQFDANKFLDLKLSEFKNLEKLVVHSPLLRTVIASNSPLLSQVDIRNGMAEGANIHFPLTTLSLSSSRPVITIDPCPELQTLQLLSGLTVDELMIGKLMEDVGWSDGSTEGGQDTIRTLTLSGSRSLNFTKPNIIPHSLTLLELDSIASLTTQSLNELLSSLSTGTSLKTLRLSNLSQIEEITTIPQSLEELEVRFCGKLERLWVDRSELRVLRLRGLGGSKTSDIRVQGETLQEKLAKKRSQFEELQKRMSKNRKNDEMDEEERKAELDLVLSHNRSEVGEKRFKLEQPAAHDSLRVPRSLTTMSLTKVGWINTAVLSHLVNNLPSLHKLQLDSLPKRRGVLSKTVGDVVIGQIEIPTAVPLLREQFPSIQKINDVELSKMEM